MNKYNACTDTIELERNMRVSTLRTVIGSLLNVKRTRVGSEFSILSHLESQLYLLARAFTAYPDSPSIMLYKIPLVLINMVIFYRSNTPPHQANAPQQKRTGVDPKSFMGLFERTVVPVRAACSRIVYSLMNVCEIATIIASQYPNHEISRHILALFNVNSLHSVGNITPTFLLGSALLIAGANIRFRCFKVMGERFTFTMSLRDSHKLCTSGPYSIVRHPAYTGGCIQIAGGIMTAMCGGSWWSGAGYSTPIGIVLGLNFVLLSAVFCVYAYLRGKKEDEFLRKEFGKQWDDWAKDVPYQYIPGIV